MEQEPVPPPLEASDSALAWIAVALGVTYPILLLTLGAFSVTQMADTSVIGPNSGWAIGAAVGLVPLAVAVSALIKCRDSRLLAAIALAFVIYAVGKLGFAYWQYKSFLDANWPSAAPHWP